MTSSKPTGGRQVPPPVGTQPRAANAYARFIPREELAGFAAWTPDAFGDGSVRSPHPGGDPTARPAPAADDTPPEPDAAAWQAQVQAARDAGYQDGYRDGLAALDAAKRQYAQQVGSQVTGVLDAFDTQIQALESRMADAVVDTALRLARQVVRSELQLQPQLIAQVAMDAMGAVMLSARHLRLRLHPDDLGLVQAAAEVSLKARDVMLLADATVARGGCLVESDLGQVDARIEQRWAQTVGVFGPPPAFDLPQDAAPQLTPVAPAVDAIGEDAAP